MIEQLTPSFITALTSLTISIITLYQFLRNQRFLKSQFDKNLERALTTKLLDLRLEYYPKAFEITDNIYKEKGGNYHPDKLKTALSELIDWRKGVVNLIISSDALKSFYTLRDCLMRSPALSGSYSIEQIEKIGFANKDFRKQLKRDLGFLFREEKLRRKRTTQN